MAQFGYYRVTVFQITQFTVVYHRYDVYFIVYLQDKHVP